MFELDDVVVESAVANVVTDVVLSPGPAGLRVDTVGEWAETKLHPNRLYLPALMKIMDAQRGWLTGGMHYIDGFAGTGQPHLRGVGQPIDGSPKIAMELAQPFDTYTFIEQEPWRAEQLRRLCAEYPYLDTRVIEADCNDVIVNEVTPVVRWERFARGFAFLDPFALNLKYSTLEAIANTKAIEIILNLPTMVMNRTVLANDAAKLTREQYQRMDSFWGDRSWFDLIYQKRDGLWGLEYLKAGTTNAERLSRLFVDHRLKPLFPYVGDPLIVRNTTGQPIYSLIFASQNAIGKKIADHVFRATQPVPPPAPVNLPLFQL